jgi:hypothetical protein
LAILFETELARRRAATAIRGEASILLAPIWLQGCYVYASPSQAIGTLRTSNVQI